jgi:hypothetical protein
MIKATLKYLVSDPDANGNPRYYVRRPGRKKISAKRRSTGSSINTIDHQSSRRSIR